MATTEKDTADITPEWLDRKFVADVIHCKEGQAVNVQQLRVTRAVGVGENYASLLLRVGVDYTLEEEVADPSKLKTTSLIVKCLPLGEIMQQFLRESGAFERESKMYTTTLPILEAIVNEGTEGEKISFGPKIYPVDRQHTIVLQDLREQGFRMADRHEGMDLAHAALVLRNLARYHAASVELHARDPEHAESYTDIFYLPEKREQIDRFVPQTLEQVAKVVDSWEEKEPGKFAGYAEKFRTFALTAVDQIMEAVKPSKTFLNVLNHGDCWVNNCLFRYAEDDGKLLDMRFVDFQITRYGSPTLDLQYLLFTSVQADVRETQWDILLNIYISQLRETLEALGHAEEAEKITQESIEKDMKERGCFGVVSSCTVLCAVVADPADAITLDGLTMEDFEKGDTHVFDRAMAGKRFNAALKRLMPMFVESGYL